MLLLTFCMMFTGIEKLQSSLSVGDYKVKTTARAVARIDGLNAVSLVATNAGKKDITVEFNGKKHLIKAGQAVRIYDDVVQNYQEKQEKLAILDGNKKVATGLVSVYR